MRKKLSLREFQEYLAKRLTGAARGEVSSARLGVLSGNEQWLLELSDAGEIMPMPPLTPVPLTKSWFAGMANIRGGLYSVVDFSAFRGGESTPRNSNTRLVLIGTRFGVNSAILVNRMLGLKTAESFTHDLGQQPTSGWEEEILVDREDRRWKRLNVPALLADPEFMQIGL